MFLYVWMLLFWIWGVMLTIAPRWTLRLFHTEDAFSPEVINQRYWYPMWRAVGIASTVLLGYLMVQFEW